MKDCRLAESLRLDSVTRTGADLEAPSNPVCLELFHYSCSSHYFQYYSRFRCGPEIVLDALIVPDANFLVALDFELYFEARGHC